MTKIAKMLEWIYSLFSARRGMYYSPKKTAGVDVTQNPPFGCGK